MCSEFGYVSVARQDCGSVTKYTLRHRSVPAQKAKRGSGGRRVVAPLVNCGASVTLVGEVAECILAEDPNAGVPKLGCYCEVNRDAVQSMVRTTRGGLVSWWLGEDWMAVGIDGGMCCTRYASVE